MRPRLLDLFCCEGGAAEGFKRAGFEVVGVDIVDRPGYPFEFVQDDALAVLDRLLAGGTVAGYALEDFDGFHASPPCQAFTHGRLIGHRGRDDHPRLIGPTRDRLLETGLPYVIENVEGARHELREPFMLCGSGFGLMVERHRLFEVNFPMIVPRCQHGVWTVRRFPSTPRADGSRPLSRIVNPMASGCSHEDFAAAMGIDWMAKRGFRPTEELREAIPPAYTEHIGSFLLAEVVRRQEMAA
jgi:DNA (cytosine-5)-methyltransferase 1